MTKATVATCGYLLAILASGATSSAYATRDGKPGLRIIVNNAPSKGTRRNREAQIQSAIEKNSPLLLKRHAAWSAFPVNGPLERVQSSDLQLLTQLLETHPVRQAATNAIALLQEAVKERFVISRSRPRSELINRVFPDHCMLVGERSKGGGIEQISLTVLPDWVSEGERVLMGGRIVTCTRESASGKLHTGTLIGNERANGVIKSSFEWRLGSVPSGNNVIEFPGLGLYFPGELCSTAQRFNPDYLAQWLKVLSRPQADGSRPLHRAFVD